MEELIGLIRLKSLLVFFRRYLSGGRGFRLLSRGCIIVEKGVEIESVMGIWFGILVFLRRREIFLTWKEVDLILIILYILVRKKRKGILQFFQEFSEGVILILKLLL